MENTDYVRIESAIRYLGEHGVAQPTLAAVAAHVGLSEHHFQRMFTRWAGISPKRFLQFQTVEHAKALLRESRSVLDTSYSTGLSSGGRLHDLFVSVEAMTPGEYKAGGAGLVIATGFHDTPFGECLIGVTDRGVCAMSFVTVDHAATLAELRARWPGAEVHEDREATGAVAARVFGRLANAVGSAGGEVALGGRGITPLAILVRGTNFQVRVWEALLRIPAGAVATYEHVAAAVGAPGATQAVGAAIGRNPVAYLIPCHRVIRKSGVFGHYRWGAARKIAMLVRDDGSAVDPRSERAASERSCEEPAALLASA